MVSRLSVGARLLLAFFGISAFSIIAAAAAMYSLFVVGGVVDRITERQVPAAIEALKVSRQAERIVAAAPALLTVADAAQHKEVSSRILSELEQLESLLADLMRDSGDRRGETQVAALSALSGELRANLQDLDALVAERITITQRKKKLLDQLLETHTGTQRLLAPWLEITRAEIEELRKSISDGGIASPAPSHLSDELTALQGQLRALQTAELETSVADEILLQAAAAEEVNRLKVLRFRVQRSLREVEAVVPRLNEKLQPILTERLQEFTSFATGADGIPDTRTRELELLEEAQRLLSQNYALTGQVTVSVDDLVASAESGIAQAKGEARSVQELSSGVLIGIVVLSVLSSIMIVWLYVRRSIVRRLTGLSDSMMAIAAGDLEAPIPFGGQDEIGGMARALEKFRDTAIDVRETNLREIQEARRRLIDAIETISEGFSLYDAEDRLVVANDRYRQLLYPEIEDAIVPGTTFEAIIRNAAERDLIPEARGKTDAWVAERLEQHHNPLGPHVQQRASGRWIRINERKVEDGSTVAVYMDITELKEHEAEIIQAKDAAEAALADLQQAQARLVQAEKMASLGQLTAGIAHEIKNPLNFVNNFARMSDEMLQELAELLEAPISALEKEVRDDAEELLTTVRENLVKINEHGKRADSIVRNMLLHSRERPSEQQTVGLNAIAEEALNLAYHGARAEHPGFNIEMKKDLDPEVGEVECFPQDLMRVFLNLISNGMYAANKRSADTGGDPPEITLTTRANGERIEVEVRDNGTGIDPEIRDKIFNPFFTTKPAGEGTGLGLSLSYDIVVKQHGGEMSVDSAPGEYTCIRVTLPRTLPADGGARP